MVAASNRYPMPRPVQVPGSNNPRTPGRPANDNSPNARPRPANDNRPRFNSPTRPRVPFGKVPPGVSPAAAAALARKAAFRMALRMIPYLGLALTAWELYQWLNKNWDYLFSIPADGPPAGYEKIVDCGTPTGPPWGWSWIGYPCGLGTTSYPPRLDPEWDTSASGTKFPDINYWWFEEPNIYGRIGVREYWQYKGDPNAPVIPPRPLVMPYFPTVTMPWEDPVPFQWQDLPIPDPVRDPWPRYDPVNNPNPGGYDPPTGRIDVPKEGTRPQYAQAPTGGTKERKVRANAAQRSLLAHALSAYSEAGDLVDALYKALPKNLQSDDDKNIAQKINRLYKHWDAVKMDEAMTNIVRDQVTDPKFAKQFQKMQEALAEYGFRLPGPRGAGGTSGPWWNAI